MKMMKSKNIFLLFLLAVMPVAAQNTKYTLSELLSYQHNNSLEAQIDSANFRSAKADQARARIAYLPQVNINTAFLHMNRELQLFSPDRLLPAFTASIPQHLLDPIGNELTKMGRIDLSQTWMAQVSIMQPIFTGGKIIASNKLANVAVDISSLRAIRNQAEREYTLRESYFNLLGLYEREKVLNHFTNMLDSLVNDVEAMYKEGLVSKSDVLDLKLAYSKANKGLMEVKSLIPLAAQNVATRAGLPTGTYVVPNESIENFAPNTSQEADIQQLDLQALDSAATPSRLKMLQLASTAAKYERFIAISNMLPKMALFANYTTLNPSPYLNFEKKFGGSFMVGVTLQIPITDIFSGYEQATAAKNKELVARLSEQNNQKLIALEQQQKRTDVKVAYEKYSFAKQQCQDSDATLILAHDGYKEGVVSMEKLIRSQSDWLDSHLAYIDALVAYQIGIAAFHLATM